jgi:chorismate mutase
MQKLKINFNRQPGQPSKLAGWLLLFAGLAMLAELGFSYNKLLNERAGLIKEIGSYKNQPTISLNESIPIKLTEKDFDDARKVIKRLSAPWDAFFNGFESISNKKVAILSIDPDIQTGVLRLEGEAKDYPAVLTFISQLRETKPFVKVFLSRHEYRRDDPQHPIMFMITMHWVDAL